MLHLSVAVEPRFRLIHDIYEGELLNTFWHLTHDTCEYCEMRDDGTPGNFKVYSSFINEPVVKSIISRSIIKESGTFLIVVKEGFERIFEIWCGSTQSYSMPMAAGEIKDFIRQFPELVIPTIGSICFGMISVFDFFGISKNKIDDQPLPIFFNPPIRIPKSKIFGELFPSEEYRNGIYYKRYLKKKR